MIFNHERQQGMGNATALLGMGKKVYMRKDVTPFAMFKGLGVKVFSIDELDLDVISKDDKLRNVDNIKLYFSLDNLRSQWKRVYD